MASISALRGDGIFSHQEDGVLVTDPSVKLHIGDDRLSLPPILTVDGKLDSVSHKSFRSMGSSLLDTSYQRAILSARARLLGGEPPRFPEEWRLPYAPLPARPDLTRTVIISGDHRRVGHCKKQRRRRGRDRSLTHPMSPSDSLTTDHSMQLSLPPINVSRDELFAPSGLRSGLPSSTVFSKSELKSSRSSDRVYLPFVGMATLHPKLVTSTDVRERDYDIPQFCYGCRKFMEFTHAQHSSTRAYVHFDESSTAKSFPEDESLHEPFDQPADMSHAVNLVEFPKRGKFCHGCEISSEPHLHLLQSPSSTAGGVTIVTQVDDVTAMDEGNDNEGHLSLNNTHADLKELVRHPRVEDIPDVIKKLQEPMVPLHPATTARERPPRIPQCVLDILKSGPIEYRKKLFEDRCAACMEALRKYFPEYFQRKTFTDPASSGIGTSMTSSEFWEEEQRRLQEQQELLEARKKLRLEEKERQKLEELERRKKLYTAPKPFQLKAIEHKTTVAKEPFTTDRKIELPKTKPFEIKKSNKPATQAVEVKRSETTWKEPKKFELKKEPAKVTNGDDRKPPPKPDRIPSIMQQQPPIPSKVPPPPNPPEKTSEGKKGGEIIKKEDKTDRPLSPIEERSRKVEIVPKERPEKELRKKPEKKVEPTLKAVHTEKSENRKPKSNAEKMKKSSPIKPEKQEKLLQEPKKHSKPPKASEEKRKSSTKEVKKEKVITKITEKIQPQVKTPDKPVVEKPPVKEKATLERLPKQPQVEVRKSGKPLKAIPIKSPKKVEKKRKKKKPKRYEEQMKKFEEEFKETLPSENLTTLPKNPVPLPTISPPPPVSSPPTKPPRLPEAEPKPSVTFTQEPKPTPQPKPAVRKKTSGKPSRRKPAQRKPKKAKPITVPKEKKKEYVAIPIIPYRQPAEVPARPPKDESVGEPKPEPQPDSALLPVGEPPKPLVFSSASGDRPQVVATTSPVREDSALIPKDANRKPKIPRSALKKPTPKKAKKTSYKKTTFAPIPERKKTEPIPDRPAPKWPEGPTQEPKQEPEVEKESPPAPTIGSSKPKADETPVELPPAPSVAKQEAIMWKKRPEYRPKKFKPIVSSVGKERKPSPEPEDNNTLDYLAKYCIVFKSRVPFYQRIFNNHLREQGIPILDDVMNSSFTQERLKQHDALTSSNVPKNTDDPSATSRTSGYVSGSGDVEGKETNHDAIQSTFAHSQPIEEEGEYISLMNIHEVEEASGTGDTDVSGNEDVSVNDDVDANDDDVKSQENGISADTMKRIEAKIGTKQLTNTFAAEDYSQRLTFDIDRKSQLTEMLKEKLHTLQESKKETVASIARKEFREIFDPEWTPERSDFHAKNTKKKTKQKKATEDISVDNSQTSSVDVIPPLRSPTTLLQKGATSRESNQPIKMNEIVDMVKTDDWILGRLATNQWQTLSTIPEVKEMNLEIERTEEKIKEAETQLTELKEEQKKVAAVANNLRGKETTDRPSMKNQFRRQQSMLYQRLNPLQEYDVNLADFEKLLQQINGNLITKKECQFIFHILELPTRYRLNFKLFAVVAALSEKVSRLEPFVRKLINKLDFEALDVKIQRAKELFHLLEEEDSFGNGTGEIPVSNLAYELEAGGLKEAHIQLIIDKFDREDKGVVDFLDYVTYIPLFIDIHDSIVSDPFGTGSTFYAK